MTPVLVVAHSPSGGERARAVFADRADVAILEPGRRGGGWRRAAAAVLRGRPRVVYLVDVGVVTAVAAAAAVLVRSETIVDTGDLVYELERSRGTRSTMGLAAIRVGERFVLRTAAHVIVRGREHLRYVDAARATFAPDFAPPGARPTSGAAVRARLGLVDSYVVGLVGSLRRAPGLGISYGWDLVEALALAPVNVAGLVVGDGDARPELERRAAELGVSERCHFVGRVPTSDVPEYVAAMDVAISTQTDDPVGRVRTTGKLPLYLACGCPVLASHVGEAAELLGPLGWTLPYEGTVDRAYPERLAGALARFAADGGDAQRRRQALELHERAFDRERIRATILGVVDSALAR